MGELLLLGHTMLNEYCELCAVSLMHRQGILMEDRQGVRCCVACDLVNTELAGGQNNRTTVSNNDDLNDLTDIATEHSNLSQSNEVLQSPVQFPSTDSSAGSFHSPVERSFSMRTVRSQRLTVDVGTSPHADLLGSGNVQVAIQAVDDKLKWCAERLKSCENVEEVMKLYEAIDCGIEILKHFMGASH
ncbi:unnamed protein product [Wuchereria bancrofti]|nr:unnamed protein product [Wuchereria bancrofti]